MTVGLVAGPGARGPQRGDDAVPFEEALHTYFAVRDVRAIEISGLAGTDYLDKVGGTTPRNQGPEPIRFTAETDRVYVNTQAACTIHDPGTRRRIVVRKSRSNATVVWNPWVDKARAMPDFGDDEWPRDGVRRNRQRQRARGDARCRARATR